MKQSISKLARRLSALVALALLVAAMGGTWTRSASAAPPPGGPVTKPAASSPPSSPPSSSSVRPGDEPDEPSARKSSRKQVAGKLNLNTASEDQLLLLPTVGPAKAERIVAWRSKNGGFKRIADLRRVKGFGYKTFKKLEPYLDIKGETTLAAR